ncbi:MAG: 7-carboxy-7-deazaguanine synthase [Blastocatellia bacterium]|jgi:7-carboxy-7-deazaguanine synthase|nr:7-carboxy-7-deazaguanine synthase [Blastocatellia bacterium]
MENPEAQSTVAANLSAIIKRRAEPPTTRLISVSEIFGVTVQGEGALIGSPTVFVRTGGCDYACRWCDTMYAVDTKHRAEWARLTSAEILGEVARLSGERPLLISLSGGNPALQPLGELIAMGHALGYTFALETQGSFAPKPVREEKASWFQALDYLTISPKPPSSGEETDWNKLAECVAAANGVGHAREADTKSAGAGPRINFKVVVFDDADYEYAREVYALYGERYPFSLSVGTPPAAASSIANHEEMTAQLRQQIAARFIWLTERVGRDGWFDVRVLPQLHVLVWGTKRGV